MVSLRRFPFSLLSVSALLLACGKDAPPAPATTSRAASSAAGSATASAAPSASAGPHKPGGPHALALAVPKEDAPVDRLIKQSQASLATRKLDPSSDYWAHLGRAWIRKARETQDPGYFQHAGAVATIMLEGDPSSVLGLGLRAQVELNQHDFRGAKNTAQTVLAKRDDDLVALGVLSDAELELGNIDEAEKAGARMMSLKPNLASYVRASYFRWLRNDSKGAKEAARLAIDSGKDFTDAEPLAWTLVQAAMIFWHQGDVAGANAGFDRALTTFADFPPALVGKGRVAMARGEGKLAVTYLQKAAKLSPLAETSWFLADAQKMAGDEAAAKETIADLEKRGKQSDPRTLALFWATRNEHVDEAVKLLAEEKKHRGDIATLDANAWALFRSGDHKGALAESDRATRLGTKEAPLLFHAGAIRIALGKTAEGKKLLEEAIARKNALDPRSLEEAEALLAGKAPKDKKP